MKATLKLESGFEDLITKLAKKGKDVDGIVRKALKETLQYVTAFATSGYVGTVAGVNIYTKKDATPGTIIVGPKEAVTLFVKSGTEIEQDRDPNKRQNDIYSRKYYIPALTNESKAVKVTVTEA